MLCRLKYTNLEFWGLQICGDLKMSYKKESLCMFTVKVLWVKFHIWPLGTKHPSLLDLGGLRNEDWHNTQPILATMKKEKNPLPYIIWLYSHTLPCRENYFTCVVKNKIKYLVIEKKWFLFFSFLFWGAEGGRLFVDPLYPLCQQH